jgi:hypothetical protein
LYFKYFVAVQYAVARKKLKEAEYTSDLNSGAEKKEMLKRSRKVRAAKQMDSSSSCNEELDDSFISELPQIPTKKVSTVSKKRKVERSARKGKSIFRKNYNNTKKVHILFYYIYVHCRCSEQ